MAGLSDPNAAGKGSSRFSVAAGDEAASPFGSLVEGVRLARDDGPPERTAHGRLWALPVAFERVPHPRLDTLCRTELPGVVMPVGRVGAHGRDWIISREPAGPPLAIGAAAPLTEADVIGRVLRPAAKTLRALEAMALTHRAIRPGNVFLAPEGGVTLGPFWLAPPAFGQPATFETPWSAGCLPEGRGAGDVSDDVYALGVLVLALLIGEVPLAGLPQAEILDRKIRLGSLSALLGEKRLPPTLHDVLSAMLADEPSQRPSPERLCESRAIVGPKMTSRRRVSAAVPLLVGERAVWTTPQLASLVATDPDAVRRGLLLGQVDHWLRRCVNEIVLAERIEAIVRPAHGPKLLDSKDANVVATAMLRISRLLDPGAPLVWRGLQLMPDAIGAVLATLDVRGRSERDTLLALLGSDAFEIYAETLEQGPAREATCALAGRLRSTARSALDLLFVTYELNPSLACRSPLLDGRPVVTLPQLLPALEEGLSRSGPSTAAFSLDHHLVAFIAARRRPPRAPHRIAGGADQLRLLASIAQETRSARSPSLARRLAEYAVTTLPEWPGKAQRARRAAALEALITRGDLAPLHLMLSDEGALRRDQAAASEAHARIDALVAERTAIVAGDARRHEIARRFGREAMATTGVAAVGLALLAAVIP